VLIVEGAFVILFAAEPGVVRVKIIHLPE